MIKEIEIRHQNVNRIFIYLLKDLRAVYKVIFQRLSTSTIIVNIKYILQLLLITIRPLHLYQLIMGLTLLKGLRNHEDYSLQGDPHREGKDILRKLAPLLNIRPGEIIQLICSPLKEFLLRTKEGNKDVLDFISEKFRFKILDIHSTMASCLIIYLLFECFKDKAIEKDP